MCYGIAEGDVMPLTWACNAPTRECAGGRGQEVGFGGSVGTSRHVSALTFSNAVRASFRLERSAWSPC
jgi:hypothetical protein